MRNFIIIIIIIALLLFFTIYNYINFINIKSSRSQNVFDFIAKNSGMKFVDIAELNIIFLVTPLDCRSCSEQLLTIEYINELKRVISTKNKSISISFVVSGDYTESEKNNYLKAINGQVPIYTDKNNKVKEYLQSAFATIRTPLMLIISNNGINKYWQTFEADPKYGFEKVYQDLLTRLEVIL